MNIKDLAVQVKSGNRTYLSKVITLIESANPSDTKKKIELFDLLGDYKKNSKRIGITGIPGSGKSSLINKMAENMAKLGQKVAIIAIDPSSMETKGSILGDKIRMENIITNDNVFIRPVPSSEQIDGVSKNIYETILLCEFAGFDNVIIETVGVGQAGIGVKDVVDCVIDTYAFNTGDDIQGIKKGILEVVDIVAINKNEEANKNAIAAAKLSLETGLSIMKQKYNDWKVPIVLTSAIENTGIIELQKKVSDFFDFAIENEIYSKNRTCQKTKWLKNSIIRKVSEKISNSNSLNEQISKSNEKNDIKKIEVIADKLLRK